MTRNLCVTQTLSAVALLVAASCWALDLGGPFGSAGDSGSGKVAKLALTLKEDFVPTAIAWSPDGRFIASSGNPAQTRSIHIWDVTQERIVKQLDLPFPPGGLFHNIAWSPDGRYLAICSTMSTSLRIYETRTWTVAKDFGRAQAGACQKPAFSDDGMELTAWAGDLVTWEVDSWQEKRHLKGVFEDGQFLRPLSDGWAAGLMIRDIAYVPRSHTLLLAGGRYEKREVPSCNPTKASYTARLWILDPQEQALERSVVVHCKYVSGGTDVEHLSISPDKTHVAVSVWQRDNRRVVNVLTVADGQLDWTPVNPEPAKGFPLALAYTPDGKYLLVGMNNGDEPGPVIIIDPNLKRVLDTVHAEGARVHDLAIGPGGNSFAAAAGMSITIWKFFSK